MKYDVFISYRREGGEYTAKIIHDKLTELGYNVFFDVESLRSGQFNTKLFSVIDECEDFISVLSPNCLDRCTNENDWVRLEVAYALQKGKNVVPILLRGFQFPEKLPEDIEQLRNHSGIEASTEFFDAFTNRLVEFLKTKPQIVHRITHNTLLKKVLPLVIALLVTFAIIFTGYKFYQTTQASFPYTKTDKNTVKEVIYYVSTNLTNANIAISEFGKATTSFQNYLKDPTNINYNTLQSNLTNSKEKITKTKEKYISLDDTLSAKLDDTILAKDDIIAVRDFLTNCTNGMLNNIDYMIYMSSHDSVLSKTSMTKILDSYEQIMDIDKDLIFYGINDIFIDVDEDALSDFKSEILPLVPNIYDGQEWHKDKEELKSITDTEYTKYQNIINEMASIVGDYNVQADDLEGKVNDLKDTMEELDKTKEEARKKFKPLETDKVGIIWGKMLRFNTLKMYDMCIECLEIYHKKDTSDEADVFIPIAEEFFKQIGTTGIDFGCLVGGYEPDKPKNSFYQVGDILIEMNGKQIKTMEDIKVAKVKNKSNKVKVLRFNGTGFKTVEGEIPVGDSMVLLYDLCEVME